MLKYWYVFYPVGLLTTYIYFKCLCLQDVPKRQETTKAIGKRSPNIKQLPFSYSSTNDKVQQCQQVPTLPLISVVFNTN